MITIALSNRNWEHGVRALLMSFFPHQEFTVTESLNKLPKSPCLLQVLSETTEDKITSVTVLFYDEKLNSFERTKRVLYVSSKEEKDVKNAMDHAMYETLSEATGITLPWGILSGIRPTKLPMEMLHDGMEDDEIIERLQNRHLVSSRKAKICLSIAKREKNLLETLCYENGFSLYVGIPFCPSTCLYCSFTSYPIGIWAKRVDDYLSALEKELSETSKLMEGHILNTIYVGGGTPSSLSALQLDRLCTMIEKYFDLSYISEFTVEAGRPDSITLDKLLTLKKHKVDRISINPQTMKQATLDLIGRHHTVENVIETYKLAREVGFDNINMDLILGLPMETADDVENTLKCMKELAPDNLTVHSLAIKRAARLNLNWDQYANMRIENSDRMMEAAYETAKEMGMNPYYLYRQKNMAGNFENVGFAKPKKEGLYNILIMEEKQTIVACGAGASTKIVFQDENRIERIENVKNVSDYVARIDEMIERKRAFFEENFKKL